MIVFQFFLVSNQLSTQHKGYSVEISAIGLRVRPTWVIKVSKIRNLEFLQLNIFQTFFDTNRLAQQNKVITPKLTLWIKDVPYRIDQNFKNPIVRISTTQNDSNPPMMFTTYQL